ncbi:hypothetical protein LENED_005970 [Lentinula edodes]|uniref:Uncharacterized protein n=1 Tax=Lentinula edodes TaxID=5353 RepID=A0A1Q3EAR9_LENED|nr:hypothetical protein LENED_005970 [Lentinula edodes]
MNQGLMISHPSERNTLIILLGRIKLCGEEGRDCCTLPLPSRPFCDLNFFEGPLLSPRIRVGTFQLSIESTLSGQEIQFILIQILGINYNIIKIHIHEDTNHRRKNIIHDCLKGSSTITVSLLDDFAVHIAIRSSNGATRDMFRDNAQLCGVENHTYYRLWLVTSHFNSRRVQTNADLVLENPWSTKDKLPRYIKSPKEPLSTNAHLDSQIANEGPRSRLIRSFRAFSSRLLYQAVSPIIHNNILRWILWIPVYGVIIAARVSRIHNFRNERRWPKFQITRERLSKLQLFLNGKGKNFALLLMYGYWSRFFGYLKTLEWIGYHREWTSRECWYSMMLMIKEVWNDGSITNVREIESSAPHHNSSAGYGASWFKRKDMARHIQLSILAGHHPWSMVLWRKKSDQVVLGKQDITTLSFHQSRTSSSSSSDSESETGIKGGSSPIIDSSLVNEPKAIIFKWELHGASRYSRRATTSRADNVVLRAVTGEVTWLATFITPTLGIIFCPFCIRKFRGFSVEVFACPERPGLTIGFGFGVFCEVTWEEPGPSPVFCHYLYCYFQVYEV